MSEQSPFTGRIKIYSDGADRASMLEMAKNPKIQGLTTNPTLMKKAGITNYREFCLDILSSIKDKPISFEVFADDFTEMEKQAMEIASWASNVYVKIPVTNSEGKHSLDLIRKLSHQKVKLNVTALLTLDQVRGVVEALDPSTPAVISVFAGRIADTGRDPIPMMKRAKEICQAASPRFELLWASVREVLNVVQAEQCGCEIVTVPFDLIAKMSMFNRDLEALSLDTVKMFKRDADSAGFKL